MHWKTPTGTRVLACSLPTSEAQNVADLANAARYVQQRGNVELDPHSNPEWRSVMAISSVHECAFLVAGYVNALLDATATR